MRKSSRSSTGAVGRDKGIEKAVYKFIIGAMEIDAMKIHCPGGS